MPRFLAPALLITYALGITVDFGLRAGHFLVGGQRQFASYEALQTFEASLFWPVDATAQVIEATEIPQR